MWATIRHETVKELEFCGNVWVCLLAFFQCSLFFFFFDGTLSFVYLVTFSVWAPLKSRVGVVVP